MVLASKPWELEETVRLCSPRLFFSIVGLVRFKTLVCHTGNMGSNPIRCSKFFCPRSSREQRAVHFECTGCGFKSYRGCQFLATVPQLAECEPSKLDVAGSKPASRSTSAFVSLKRPHFGFIWHASPRWLRRWTANPAIVGSNPTACSIFLD